MAVPAPEPRPAGRLRPALPRGLGRLVLGVVLAHALLLNSLAPSILDPAQPASALATPGLGTPSAAERVSWLARWLPLAHDATGPSGAAQAQPRTDTALHSAARSAPHTTAGAPAPDLMDDPGPTDTAALPPLEPSVHRPRPGRALPGSGSTPSSQPEPEQPPSARLAAGLGLPAVLTPPDRVLHYQVRGESHHLPYTASAQLRWQAEGGRYQAALDVSLFLLGKRSQTSRGLVDAQGLAPERFSDSSRGSEVATHFERDKARISFSVNTPSATLLPGAQDRLSLFVQLASRLASDVLQRQPGTVTELQVAGPREAENWRFVVDGPDTLQLPGGSLDTVKLTRWPQGEHDHRLELWFASSLDWLPARIRITQGNGDFVDQLWER